MQHYSREPSISVDDLAKRFEISTKAIYQYIAEGKIEAHKIGKGYKFSEQQVQDYLESTKTSHNIKTQNQSKEICLETK